MRATSADDVTSALMATLRQPHCSTARGVRHVVGGGQRVRCRAVARMADVRHRDVDALLREGDRDGAPDTTPRAGHDGDLSREVHGDVL
jgi:hypothetical protein